MHLSNEFQELYLDALIAYYITLHYANERSYLEAILLNKHALQQIEGTLDFVAKSGTGNKNIEKVDPKVAEQCTYLKDKIHLNLRKIQVKMHARYLQEQAEQKVKTEQALKNVDVGQSQKATIHLDNLYDLLFDPSGVSKTSNLNQKIVIRGDTLEILESEGSAIGFESIDKASMEEPFDKLKWNKGLKIVNPLPKFQSVPATAHLFDLAGATIDYPELADEAAAFQV